MATSYLMSNEFNNLDIKIVCINQQRQWNLESLEKGCNISNRYKQVIKRSKILMRIATFSN